MKIILNLLAATAGGQVTRAVAFVDNFQEFAPNAQLIVLKPVGVMPNLTSRSRIEVVDIPIGLGRTKAFQRIFWENISLKNFIQSRSPNVLLTFSHYLPIRDIGIPTVVAVSNLAPFTVSAYKVEGFWGRIRLTALRHTILSSAKRATSVIALSNICKQILIDNNISPEKITVISNGAEANPVVFCNHEKYSSDKYKYILTVSNFYRYKNFEQLLRAYSLTSASIRNNYSLKIVGYFYDTKYVSMLMDLADRLGIRGNVEFIPGLTKDKLSITYQKASLFIFTSLIENCPNILLEAMAHGKPILSVNADPMPEFGGDAVRYFTPGNDVQLASNIELLLLDQNAMDELSSLARTKSKQFSWARFTESVVKLCSRVS